ncbi:MULTISPECIES: spore protease YyaC [unclassified Candidatus Frackibacter]|uniref:spore protease YyaC n=1 Tax=unclassified Candidatus Frackibacter TaxID=2648818 RepID=UPI0008874740|nr:MULTISPECIES: spore protease YyaC [unclassified Candidatus Frackibacter]SDC44128.1 putative sporulation protein YyaC [Candidatus Frackibacter sp. WG11]SEM64368.1 putative sporulation protein YyaC [Candidatus Frackibacter sp. WG12]SFL68289.1 putative sporulation protein YyaC [Candidatus Frackibacter sp. WG13]
MGNFEAITCKNCGRQIMDLNFFANTQTVCNNCAKKNNRIDKVVGKLQKQKFLEERRVHIDDRLAANKLKKLINKSLSELYNNSYSQLIILCIGTDRSTGDALGPLVGSRLNRIIAPQIPVFGTLENPVHATNLEKNREFIAQEYFKPFILAIDAGLGKNKSVGSISVNHGALKPGSGVNKNLSPIGNMHITGLVNIGGYMEYFVLQSTRLSLVVKMAKLISRGISWGLRSKGFLN